MKNLVSIDPIAVKDKNDVVKALTILERLGIKIMAEEQKKNYLADEKITVDNDFIIQEEDGRFRIQSHYIGFGISIECLEMQVNDILEKYPDICERIIETETKINELKEKKQKLTEEINNIKFEIKEIEKSYSVIELKEEKN